MAKTRNRRLPILILIALSLLFIAERSYAAGRFAAGFRECSYYRSAQHFVREATVFCVKQGNVALCEREAKKYFRQCGFRADYQVLSESAYSQILLAFVLVKTPELSSLSGKAQ